MDTMDSQERQAPQPQEAPRPERRFARRIDCAPPERPAPAAPPASDPAPPHQAPPR